MTMTQAHINTMDTIVTELANGKTISEALKTVYDKRTVQISFTDELFEVDIQGLGMSNRATNALLRNHIRTINDVINSNKVKPIKDWRGCGKDVCTEVLETILNYYWEHATTEQQVDFLINTVVVNEFNAVA